MLKTLSLIGLFVMAIAIVGLCLIRSLFSLQPIAIALQAGAVALMAWARLIFGHRSFHASADPTAGGACDCRPVPIYSTSNLHSGMPVRLGWRCCALVLGKRRAQRAVASGCPHPNVLRGASG
jgi:hypothetical protein